MMATSSRGWGWQLGLASLLGMSGAIATTGNFVLAQITPDGTLGAESSVVTPTNIDGRPTEQIDGGATRGANLFHSFEQFSVPTGGAAYFNNALDIQNIISRVTGGSVSNIDGLIRANASANLFLLNPNGILFGPNARLNIGGSILGSTASSLNFADGTQFSATAPTTTPLLTVSVPIGLQFWGTAGSILNKSRATNSNSELVGLQVPPGKTIMLVGGDVSLDGGRVFAPGGRVELGGLAGSGTIGLNVNGNDLRLSFPDSLARADINLLNSAYVNVNGLRGGSIIISAQNLNISASSLLSDTLSDEANSGSISLQADGFISLLKNSFLSSRTSGEGNAGSILLQSNGPIFIENSSLNSFTSSEGNAGSISLQSNDSISLENSFLENGSLYSYTSNNGDAGSILLQANSFISLENSSLNSFIFGEGNAGSISLQSNDSISLENSSLNSGSGEGNAGSISLQANADVSFAAHSNIVSSTNGRGKGGDIYIQARSVSVTDGAELQATTDGSGNAGNIQVDAIDSVTLSGFSVDGYSSGLLTATNDDASGQGGYITVQTGALHILDGAVLSARTRGEGDGGNITVNVSTLEITGGGQMLTTAFSSGDAGIINVNAADSISLVGSDPTFFDRLSEFGGFIVDPASPASGLFSNSNADSTGNSGTINIWAGQLLVRDGAQVNVSSAGFGAAGDLTVSAGSIVELNNQSSIRATTAAGNQGNITLRSPTLLLRRSSQIITNATGTATGGNITLNTDILTALENSDIIANASEGRGGNVQINTQGLFLSRNSQITASSERGIDGLVEINKPDVDTSLGLATLPVELVEVSGLIATGCADIGKNEFIITGRGGLPLNPSETLGSDTVWTDLRLSASRSETQPIYKEATQPNEPMTEQLVEAQGWVINNFGEVVLTAQALTVTPHSPWMRPLTCHTPEPES